MNDPQARFLPFGRAAWRLKDNARVGDAAVGAIGSGHGQSFARVANGTRQALCRSKAIERAVGKAPLSEGKLNTNH